MNNDKFQTLFGSPETPDQGYHNELEAAYSQGFLKLRGAPPVSNDQAAQAQEEAEQQAILMAVISAI